MRRFLFVTLIVAAIVLSACGGGAKPAPTAAPAPTQAPVAQAQPTMAPEPTKVPEPTKAPEPTKVTEPTKAPEPTAAPTAAPAAAGVMLPEVNPLEVKGDIIMAGSSTVYPLAEAIAERFKDEGYAGNITIDSIGSGAGLRAVLQGGRDGHRQREPGDQGLRGRGVQGDRPGAVGGSGRHGCAGRGGESGERLAEGWRDAGGAGEDLLQGRGELVGREPGVAEGSDQALQPGHGQRDLRLLRRGGDGQGVREGRRGGQGQGRGSAAGCGEPATERG